MARGAPGGGDNTDDLASSSLAPFAAAAADVGWATFGGGGDGDPFAACKAAPISSPLPSPTEEKQQQQQQAPDWRL